MADNELEIVDQGAKKKKLMMLVALVVVLAGAGGGYFFFMGSDTPAASSEVAAEGGTTANGASVSQGTALYVQLPRPFVFNVAGLSRDRLVQIRVQLMVRGETNQALALKNIPLIESALLATFSAANADELISATGKEELKNKALIDLQNAMLDVVGSVVIAEVLFTGFVMQ